MKIAFNPSTVAALTTPPNNKDITFDLRGRNIFARGVKFYGTDTNTWRSVTINGTSLGTKTLELKNGNNISITANGTISAINLASSSHTHPLVINGKSFFLGTTSLNLGTYVPWTSNGYSLNVVTKSGNDIDTGGGLYIDANTGTQFYLWLHDTSNVWYKKTASGSWKKMDAGNADTWGGYSAQLTTENTSGTKVLVVDGNNVQYRTLSSLLAGQNTWRNILINGTSIGTNILNLKNGSNIVLSNTNGQVTISANGLASSGHTHDDKYLKLSGGTMVGDIYFSNDSKICWSRNTDSASISFKNDGDGDTDSYMSFVTSDNGNEYFRWSHTSGTNVEWMSLKADGLRIKGTKVSLENHSHTVTINGTTKIISNSTTDLGYYLPQNGQIAGWGTLTSTNGFTAITHFDLGDRGAFALAGKNGQMFMLLNGTIYVNEGSQEVATKPWVEGKGYVTGSVNGNTVTINGVSTTWRNTWRDIKINNVSIGSNTLDLRNGSNTTLTNTNGVVTINSTWRPVVDNLTSDSTTSSLSAKQGKVLKSLIDGKSNSGHTHDDRYLKLTGGIMASNALITFADSGSWGTDKGPQGARGGLYWTGQSDYAKLYAEETAGDNLDLVIQFGDDNSNGLSIRNASNVQTSYISAGGVITTGTFKGNLDWSYITNKPATATRWPSWAEVTGKPSSFTPSTHTHGLSNSVFFLNMPNISGNATWKEAFGYPVNYNLLLSVRINSPAPEWCVGNYGSGILYGGSDTKGFMSSAYNEPLIMWAGGNGSSNDSVPKWYIGIRGTHKSIYNLTTIASEANAAYNLRHSHANKSVLDGITSGLVNNWNTAYTFVNTITGTDTDKVINKWDEIVNFLAGITEDNKLNTLLNSKLSILLLSAKDILTTKTNNALFWVNTVSTAGSITTGPFTDHPYALLSVTNYSQNDTNSKFFYRSRLAFSSTGDIKVASCHHQNEYKLDETWYNVLTSKNSGISGSTIKLNGTSITVYSSGTADGRYVKKSGDTMAGALNFANVTWNKVGDDIYMGDHNIGGQLCLMGITGNTGISFHKLGDASIRKSITFNGSTLYMNGNCDYASLANLSNLLAMNTVPNKTTSTSVGSWSPISGRYVFHQKWTDTSTGSDGADFGIYLDGDLTANMVLDGYYNSLLGFRVIGATGGFLKANGTIDHNTYLTSHQSLSNYYTKGEINTKLNNYLPLSGGTMKGLISSAYSVGTWIGGCTNAIIKAIADGYNSLICAPIKSGNICISAWTAEDNLNFGYAKKGKTENAFDTRMYWDAPNNNLHATAFTGHLYGTADNAVNADTVDGVHLEWAGELGVNDYTWLAGWTNDGKRIKAVNKNLFATSSHSHNYYAVNENYGGFKIAERLPTSGFYQSNESESGGNAPWKSWMHLINCQHSNTGNNYALLIAASFYDNNTFKIRVTNNNVNTTWNTLIHSGNYTAFVSDKDHTHSQYIKRTGDTMQGALNFANGTWNLVGDDSYMGDCNVAGHFGIKAANTTYPGIAFFNNSGTHLGNLTAYNGNIKYRAYSLQFLDNGNTSVSASTWMNPFSTYNASAIADGQAICVWGQSSYLNNLASDSGNMSLWLRRINASAATLNMVLDGEYYANGNLRLAHVSEIPTALKNPYALTISLNGTSQGPYDGSAAKNINITPSSIGAATSGHNHDGRYVYNYGGTANVNGLALNQNALFMSTTSSITGDWWHILQAAWNGEYRWNSLIAFPTLNRNGMYYRSGLDDNTKWGSWVKLLDINNYSSVLDIRYITNITTSVNKLTFTKNGSNIDKNIKVNNVLSLGRRNPLTERNAISGIYTYGTYSATDNLAPSSYFETLGFGEGAAGTIEIGGSWISGGELYWRALRDCCEDWFSWKTILDTNNYSGILDSRYYTELEVNNLLNAKLNRQNLSYGTWNPRGYNLAADYSYNGGDLSISESGGKIHISVDGYFWLNEGLYRVLDTSDVAELKGNLTVYLYLSNTDTAWYPLIWGGSAHNNTNNSTGEIYKSHDKLSWLTSSLTLYATKLLSESLTTGSALFVPGTIKDATLKIYSGRTTDAVDDGHIGLLTSIDSTDGETHIYPTLLGSRCVLALLPRGGSVYIGNMPNGGNGRKLNVNGDIGLFNTGSIRDLAIGGGIYWNPYVESATDGSDAASITLVRLGVEGGTTLVLSLMNDANDTILFKTNGSARLYHNSYPILTTLNTYVSGNKGYINNTEITLVNNANKWTTARAFTVGNTSKSVDGSSNISWSLSEIGAASSNHNHDNKYVRRWEGVYGSANKFLKLTIYDEKGWIRLEVSDSNNALSGGYGIYIIGWSWHGNDGADNLIVNCLYANDSRYITALKVVRTSRNNYDFYFLFASGSSYPSYTINYNDVAHIDCTVTAVTTIPTATWTSSLAALQLNASQVDWSGITNKPSAFNPAAHTHTVFKNNLMIKGTNGVSDSASIHLGIGDSDTGFKWISDGVCQIYANNVAVGEWTSGGMNWFRNPTVNGNKIWNAGNDGSGSGLDADTVDGYHASSFALVNNINYADLYAQKFITGKLNDGVTRWLVYAFNGNQTQTVDNLLSKIPDKVLSPNGSNVVTQLTTGIYLWEDNNIGNGNYADSYTGYARTYLYSNSAQTLTFVIYTDDNSSIFLNNTLLATPSSCQNTSLSFSLVKGWNKIEIIWYEGGGGDGFHVNYNGSRLHNSFLIDCFAIDSNNYSNSAGSATKVIVNLHTTNDINYPLVWSNLPNTSNVTENQLFKSWADLYYNPKNKRLTVGGSVVTSSFIKSGGNYSQLLRADGGIATFNWSGQSGLPTWLWGGNDFNSYYVYNPSNFNVNTALYLRSLGNLNCQTGRTLNYGDVYTYNTYGSNTGSPTTYTSVIGFGRGIGGTVEIAGGWCDTNLYWRSLRDCCDDWYSWRAVLDSTNYTEFINNYYWANVKISTSSSTTTSPTVSNLTATNSIRMGNILLEHTDEINNITNGGLHLNYRNSGNVSLCLGGGNVGIGTMSPSYKLDVNGNIWCRGALNVGSTLSITDSVINCSSSNISIKSKESGSLMIGSLEVIRYLSDYTSFCNKVNFLYGLSLRTGTTSFTQDTYTTDDVTVLIDTIMQSQSFYFKPANDGLLFFLKIGRAYSNVYFWCTAEDCEVVKANGFGVHLARNETKNYFNDGLSRIFIYKLLDERWYEFYCG